MGGHNKWSQIKRQKGAEDAKKSKVWGKLARRITVESKRAKGDANDPTIRTLLEKGRSENMPKDAIERAIAKGISTDSGAMESITYECYGPGGVAILIHTLTDSRNRTAQEIKHLLSELGIELAAPGSAMWAFKKVGIAFVPETMVEINEEDGQKLSEVIEKIEDYDDTEEVLTNAA